MNHGKSVCVLPSPTEIELGTIPGSEPGTAIRVRVEPLPTGPAGEGYARIEQLAYSADLGWYTQKSFVVPASLIKALVTELRKADCYMPRQAELHEPVSLPFPGPDQPPHDRANETVRREA